MTANFPKNRRRREFSSRPLAALEQQFRDWTLKTARPEDFADLHHGPIERSEDFVKLLEFEVDQGKRRRLGLEKIPCAMCTPNKFYRGCFVWLPRLKTIAIIGHCCADKEKARIAEAEYRARRARDNEENYLLAKLGLVPAGLRSLKSYESAANEALRVYRHFRNKGVSFFKPLKDVFARGGELFVDERLQGDLTALKDAGAIRGGVSAQTRRVSFGYLEGSICFLSDYNPVRELGSCKALLERWDRGEDEGDVLDFIVDMCEKDRIAACVSLREANKSFLKFRQRLDEFTAFFSEENIRRLHEWGGHPENTNRFEVIVKSTSRKPYIEFRSAKTTFVVVIDPVLWATTSPWPDFS